MKDKTFASSSVLFGPAGRLDYVPKFARSGAHVAILDLEASTPEAEKATHRARLAQVDLRSMHDTSMKLLVRTNEIVSDHFAADIEAAAAAGVDGVVVPLVESADDVHNSRRALADAGLGEALLMCGIETARGVLNAAAICGGPTDLVYFGAEDFVTDMLGQRTASNLECQWARSMVVVAARASAKLAIDQVAVEVSDHDRFIREAAEARAMGFAGKLCIHPQQVELANTAFEPSEAEVEWAAGVIAAGDQAESEGSGATTFRGEMVDAPIRARAERIMAAISGGQKT